MVVVYSLLLYNVLLIGYSHSGDLPSNAWVIVNSGVARFSVFMYYTFICYIDLNPL